jgi:DNA repair protein RecO
MSHHIYHTEAIMLGGRSSGEGDRMLYCYTRDLGFVVAHAKSIREARSRLRYTLQLFSHANVDLIRGKHGWKLISASPISSFRDLWSEEQRRVITAQHASLLRRLIQGEEKHEQLFDDIISGLRFLSSVTDTESLRDAELLMVVRLLAKLGYWGEHSTLVPFPIGQSSFSSEELLALRPIRSQVLAGVNEAIHSSQL